MTGRRRSSSALKKVESEKKDSKNSDNESHKPVPSTSKRPKFSDKKKPSSQDIRKYINANSQDFDDDDITIESEDNPNESLIETAAVNAELLLRINDNEESLQELNDSDFDPKNAESSESDDDDSSDEEDIENETEVST